MSAERLTLFMEIKMLTRVFAASIAVMALAAPHADKIFTAYKKEIDLGEIVLSGSIP